MAFPLQAQHLQEGDYFYLGHTSWMEENDPEWVSGGWARVASLETKPEGIRIVFWVLRVGFWKMTSEPDTFFQAARLVDQ